MAVLCAEHLIAAILRRRRKHCAEGDPMYIGIGTIVVIILIILLLMLVL